MYILARGKGLHTYNSAKKSQLYVSRCRKSGFFAYNTAENGQLYVFVISATFICRAVVEPPTGVWYIRTDHVLQEKEVT